MILTVTEILNLKYNINGQLGKKSECPFCHKMTLTIKSDNSMGKCFHPDCGRTIFSEEGDVHLSENRATMQPTSGCTLDNYANKKNLPVDFLKNIGLTQIYYSGCPVVRIPYFDERGKEVAIRFRKALIKSNRIDNRFYWKKGSKPLPYGLWKLNEAKLEGYIVIVEGESDCHTLWYSGIPALGIPGADTWKEEWADFLNGISVIYVVKEPDAGGEAVLKRLSKSKIRDKVRFIYFDLYKDPSELYLSNPSDFKKNWEIALTQSRAWGEIESDTDKQIAQLALEKCESIASNPSILDLFISDLKGMSFVGEERNAKLIFLALISRFLGRPVSISIKGPSSCGKSYVIEQVLKYFPESSFYRLTGMSDLALVYSGESLSYRYLIICEASGLDSEKLNYFLRSLLSEGFLRYETVEKTTNGFKPRLIQKDGPTGLILSTTKLSLHPENETRMLSLSISDTREQTHDVLLAIAKDSNESRDISSWHALQIWLERSNHRVAIPYATKLAELIPPVHVRLRRDFTQILNLIKANAILHQKNRLKNEKGEIIACIKDYEIVRELICDIVGDGIGMVVSGPTRETVECVRRLLNEGPEHVKEKDLATALHLDKSTVHRRVKKAISLGFLVNSELIKFRPAKLVLGDSIPEDVNILPPADVLEGCTVALNKEDSNTPPSLNTEISEPKLATDAQSNLEVLPWKSYLKE